MKMTVPRAGAAGGDTETAKHCSAEGRERRDTDGMERRGGWHGRRPALPSHHLVQSQESSFSPSAPGNHGAQTKPFPVLPQDA